MKLYLDCYACFVRQALEATRFNGADERRQHEILGKVLGLLQDVDLSSTPPEIGWRIHGLVREEMGITDPYREVKRQTTEQALALYPRLVAAVAAAEDPLDCAVRVALAGNIIDFGLADAPRTREALWASVEEVLEKPLAIDDLDELRARVETAQEILFLADNAGETVFDRVLIETLGRPTVYMVKGGPVLNDATAEDAIMAGVDRAATLMRSGSNAPGTLASSISEKARAALDAAEVILAKGQANYETLSGMDLPVFFLLQAKCPVIAQDVGVPVRGLIVLDGQTLVAAPA